MRPIAAALLALVLLVATQLVVWRLRRPGHYTALSVLSLIVLLVSLAAIRLLQTGPLGPVPFLPATGLDYWNFLMLHGAVTVAYMVTYSAVQADSPTMLMLLLIEAAGSKGATAPELMGALTDDVLINPRLDDLLIGRLASLHGGRYVITSNGSVLARIYIAYRALLKMGKGG